MKNKKYFNRELSWVEFNYRVLEEALDKNNPLLERLKFCAIFSNNLDEFFMVRIAGIVSQVNSDYNKLNPAGFTPKEMLEKLHARIKELVNIEYNILKNEIIEGLEKEGFKFYTANNIPKNYIPALRDIFLKKLFLILTPMAIDQARPFPFLKGKSLNILINLKSPKKEDDLYAVIPVPASNRFIQIPDETGISQKYIYIEELIKLFVKEIFKGYEIIETCNFRITRDAELSIDEEDVIDLLSAIEDELKKRVRGAPIRLEVESKTSDKMVDYLLEKINVYKGFYFSIDGPLDLSSFFEIASIDNFDHIKQEPLIPIMPIDFIDNKSSIFEIISVKDRLLHVPYESFDPITKFIEEASTDKKVLAIKITLYRISENSPLINALKKAAENGKQVTVLVELKARFDEERNINWAKELEKAGCHVIYGLVGLKIHAKIALVVRDEEDGIKRYIHLSTGNYNDNTAKIYTDISIFTCKKSFGRDASSIFNLLTGFSQPPRWKKLVCAPLDLRNFFLEKIRIEIENVKKGAKGKIIAKMNSLIDIKIIDELYKASKAGVKIILIVRGMCRLIPQLKNLSDNITVISIVGRFLEHSRIYYFYNIGEEDIYLSSADWMERNLDNRVEILFPILDIDLKQEILDVLDILMKDNVKSRILHPDGMYYRLKPKDGDKIVNSQKETYKFILKLNKPVSDDKRDIFIPKMNPEEEKKL